ncbi:hypothetical protein CS0771_01120 [Catellatospora sp. IY07-71]|uniref:hypothetical protein n=1 Tax=Catellatospora sp. IY07-71 TaxID=2728827 RepID=UPI001BB417FA|nr:hypothetical protein [Catellatospora sp. IY07-71]BCJ70568.1 hypothetical protein CS0771_01120 [Catellatospora sp. IY07-71]
MRVRQPLTAASAVMALGIWLTVMSVVLRDPGTGDTGAVPRPPRAAAPARHAPTWPTEPSGSPTEVGRTPVGPAPTMVGRTPAPTTLAPYTGTWRAHGSELTIGPDGATEILRLGPCRGLSAGIDCVATATLRADLSKGEPELVYTGFRYTDGSGAVVVPDSLEGLPVAGDGYRLRVFAPGVIELVPLTPHLRQIMGTPYRCAAGANEYAHQRLCNA